MMFYRKHDEYIDKIQCLLNQSLANRKLASLISKLKQERKVQKRIKCTFQKIID